MEQIEVKLTPTPGEQRPLDEIADDLWGRLGTFLTYYLGADHPDLDAVLGAPCDARLEGSGEGALTFAVPPGEPAAIARVGIAAALHQLDEEAGAAGWWIAAPRDDVGPALAAADPDLPPEHPLRTMMTPAPRFAAQLHKLLGDEDLEGPHLTSAAWYLGNMATPPLDLVEALMLRVEARPDDAFKAARGALERASRRADLRSLALARLEEDRPAPFALGMILLGARADRGGLDPDEWCEVLERGLALGEPAADVCADLIGRERPDDTTLARLTLALFGALGAPPSEETQHNALLSLINLYMHRADIPPGLLEILDDQTGAPAPIGGLAAWAIAVFKDRPIQSTP